MMRLWGTTRSRAQTWGELSRSAAFEKLALLAVVFVPFQFALTINVGFPLKISEILIALAAIMRLVTLIVKRRWLRRGFDMYAMGAIALIVIVSTAYTILQRDVTADVSGIDHSLLLDAAMYGAYAVVIVVAWMLLRDTDRTLLRDALLAGLWLCLLAVIAQAAFLAVSWPDPLEVVGFDMRRRGQDVFGLQLARSGPFLEGQHLGFYAGAMCVVALTARRWVTAAAALVCVLYSQSTTGALGLAAAALVYVIVRPTRRTLIGAGAMAVLGAVAVLLVPQMRAAAMFQLSKLGLVASPEGVNATQSIDVRGIKSEIGWRMMLDNPILGAGPGRYGYEFPKYSHDYNLPGYYYTADIRAIAENGYAQLGAELGVFALLAFISLIVWLFVKFARSRSPLVAVVAFVAVAFATQSSWTFIPIWAVLGYLCACAAQPKPDAEQRRDVWSFSPRGDAAAPKTVDSSGDVDRSSPRREYRMRARPGVSDDKVIPPAARSGKRLDIQGLRAFAVLVVLFDHMVHVPSGGFAGVDMFFVISGFLITGLLLREYERTGTISFARFYASRVKRIMPAALLVLGVTVVLAFFVMGRSRAVGITWDAVWATVFGANWNFLVKGTDYFQQDAAVSPLQHYWSLSVEEQFYFVWPWLLLGLLIIASKVRKQVRTRRIAALAMGVIVIASLGWAMHSSVTTPTSAYFSTFTRAWELGIGALIAVVAPMIGRIAPWARTTLSYLGLALMVISVLVIDASSTWPAPWAILPVVATALVIISGIGEQARGNVILTNPVSVYIGDISYSLYLWHFPVIIFAGILFPDLSGAGYFAILLVSLSVSMAAYHLVEYPIHKSPLWTSSGRGMTWGAWMAALKPSLLKGSIAAAAGVVLIFCAVIFPRVGDETGTVAVPEQGAEETDAQYALTRDIVDGINTDEWPSDIDTQMQNRADWDDEVRRCSDPATFEPDGCTYGHGDRVALVIGDSLARAYTPSYKRILDPDEWTIVQMTLNGCEFSTQILASERSEPLCEDHNESAIEAARSMSPDVVLVTSQWAQHRVFGKEQEVPIDEWWSGAEAALEQVEAPIIYVAPPPFQKSIESCYTPVGHPEDCVSEASAAWKESERLVSGYAEARDGVELVSSLDWFCVDDRCPAIVDGRLTRSDMVHPGQPYLESIEAVMAEAIEKRLPQS